MKTLPWLLLAAAAAWLIWSRRRRVVVSADGRSFSLIQPASAGNPSIWRAIPDDGREYFPDLGFDLGNGQAPLMQSFS